MTRILLGSCCILLVAAGISYAQPFDEPVFDPVALADDPPAAPADKQSAPVASALTEEPKSSVPDPQYYDPANRRFDSGPGEAQQPPQPLPVINLLPGFKVLIGGTATADFVYASQRTVANGTPFFLTPASPIGASTQTFNALGRQSALFAIFQGPEVCCFETGGVVAANFYASNIFSELYGLLPIEAFGHLRNEDWRFAFGLQLDIFNPRIPTVLPFSMLFASGNAGAYRGQARAERYFYPSDESQITLQVGLSDPISTFITDSFQFSEDNGAPNFEGRAMLGLGASEGQGLLAHRPFEIAVSGVVGKFRTVQLPRRVVASVWGFGSDWA